MRQDLLPFTPGHAIFDLERLMEGKVAARAKGLLCLPVAPVDYSGGRGDFWELLTVSG